MLKNKIINYVFGACVVVALAIFLFRQPHTSVDEQTDALNTDTTSDSADWVLHGRTNQEQRFSPLTNINDNNAAELGLAWSIDLPDARGQEATPLVVNGVMYTTAAWSIVYAINAATGEVLWIYDPKVDRSVAVKGCCDAVNRGVAYWEGDILVGTLDGRLVSIKAEDGSLNWQTLTVDTSKPYTITGAPRVAKGKVFIGNGGAEFGVRGYMSAYDIKTGEMDWRFYTVPGNPALPQENPIHEKTLETWNGEWWELGGGGTVWDSMAYDPELDLLYIGVGNGSPWNPKIRSDGEGDNLFLSSIVALKPDSGEYVWHYQTTPNEGWDYTATQHMILADMDINGETRKVIMQAPKNGFFYVLDRQTGELISANNFVPVTWASHIDLETGRPVVNPEAQYWKTGEVSLQSPGFLGGHNWHPMSYSPDTGLVYLPAQEMLFPYKSDEEFVQKNLAANLGVDTSAARLPDNPDVISAVKAATKGQLLAWDPKTQQEVWRVSYPGPWNGGVLSTAGNIVAQGSAAGFFNIYRATDGEALWQFPAQTGIVAPPITYKIDGEQYIVVMAGWGGIFPLITGPLSQTSGQVVNRSRVLAFKLGGDKRLSDPNIFTSTLPDFSDRELDPEKVEAGFHIYDRFCGACHGAGGIGGGVIPDLRFSGALGNEVWHQIIRKGLLESNGMANFGDEISREDSEAMEEYMISRNQYAREQGELTRLGR